jgi:hypothetical protein
MSEHVEHHNKFVAFTQFPQIEEPLEKFFTKTITFVLPTNVKEFIVQYSPYIGIVLGLLLLPFVLGVFGLAGFAGMMGAAAGIGFGIGYYASIATAIAQIVMYFLAYTLLIAKKKEGWNLMVYSNILSVVVGVFTATLIGSLLGAAIGLYVLFQVKYYYK